MKCLLSLLLVICLSTCLRAQQPFTRDIWLSEAGVAVRVSDLSFAPDGTLWLATDAGLAHFNGRSVSFEASKEALTAVCAQGGKLYTGGRDGRVYGYTGSNRRLLLKSGVAITSLKSAPYGLIVCTGGDGIYLVQAGRVVHYDSRQGLPDDYVYRTEVWGKSVVVASDRGLSYIAPWVRRKDGKLDVYLTTGGDIARVVTSGGNPRAALWSGFQMAGISRRGAPEAWQDDFGRLPDVAWQWGAVNDILPHGDGAWIATEDGFVVHLSGGPAPAYAAVALSGKKINRLAADRTGNIWAATSDGLSMISGQQLQQITVPNLALREVSSIGADAGGWIWYAQGAVISGYHPGKAKTKTVMLPAPVNCFYTDSRGRMWIGTSGGGLYCRHPDRRVEKIRGIANLQDAHILSITGTGNRLWVSGLNGVEELRLPADGALRNMAVRHHGKRDGLGSDYVYRIYTDRAGRTWFATDGAGVAMLDAGGYHRWDSAAGFHSKVVYSLTEDASGNIWAGTLNDGLLRYDGRAWKRFGPKEGLDDPTIFTVAANGDGQVAAVGARSLSIWYPADSAFRHFDRRNGLGVDSFTDALNAAATTQDGRILLPFNGGLLQVDIAGGAATSIHPAVRLAAVTLFSKPIDTAMHRFAPDDNQIGFQFEGINFAHGERLYYRYRLAGLTDEWTQTADASVSFSQLPPGEYRFVVEASLDAGFGYPAAATWSFTVQTPLWKRWWVILLAAVSLGLLAWAVLRARVRAVKKVSQLESEKLRFEYEHLRSQVNPHFLFNSLNTLTGLIEEDPQAAARYTEALSDFYRNSLALHNRDLVPLAEELALLQHYLYIQQSRFGDALQLETSIPEKALQASRIVPLALQLLVENAIKHNIVSRSQPLMIRIEAGDGSIAVSNPIRPKSGEKVKGTGLGLENIRKRYAMATARPVGISSENGMFVVTLPLL